MNVALRSSCAGRYRSRGMQDRYAGDIGDFSELGLLRWLVAAAGDAPLRLGLLWWPVADDGHSADGRHVQHLSGAGRTAQHLYACDDELARALMRVVESERSVRGLQASGALQAGTRYFDEALDFAALAPACRAEHLLAWLDRGLAAIGDAALVCVDPENRIEIASSGLQAKKDRSSSDTTSCGGAQRRRVPARLARGEVRSQISGGV
jgi:hypothetical protein